MRDRWRAMSCFWDALIRELSDAEATRAGLAGHKRPTEFARQLISLAASSFVLTKWQGRELTEQQRRENAAAVAAYDVSNVNNGYYCGSCDPFLLLLSHLAGVHIRHRTPSGTFEYTSQYPDARWMELRSTSNHMQ